jgi:hypothetical protein
LDEWKFVTIRLFRDLILGGLAMAWGLQVVIVVKSVDFAGF